jgi:hypothetical protein
MLTKLQSDNLISDILEGRCNDADRAWINNQMLDLDCVISAYNALRYRQGKVTLMIGISNKGNVVPLN